MWWGRFGFLFFSCGWLLLGLCAGPMPGAEAQSGPGAPQTSIAGEIASLASRSACIFVGQVAGIERRAGVVEVTFRVELAVAGDPGASYVLREWAGLWPQGQYRYTVGQRALLFLHDRSPAGLGSPVDGADGVVPVVVQGADAPELLDIRRLASAICRSLGTPLPTAVEGAIQLGDAVAAINAARMHGLVLRTEPVRRRLPFGGPRPTSPEAGSGVLPSPGQGSGPLRSRGPLAMPVALVGDAESGAQNGLR